MPKEKRRRSRGANALGEWMAIHGKEPKDIAERTKLTPQAVYKLLRPRTAAELRRQQTSAKTALLIQAATAYAEPDDAGLVPPVPASVWLLTEDLAELKRLEGIAAAVEVMGRVASRRMAVEGFQRMLDAELAYTVRNPPATPEEVERHAQNVAALERLVAKAESPDFQPRGIAMKALPPRPEHQYELGAPVPKVPFVPDWIEDDGDG